MACDFNKHKQPPSSDKFPFHVTHSFDAMPRKPRAIPGPSRLSGILADLTRQPRLELSRELTSLKLSHKIKNGDFGARYVFAVYAA